MNILVDSLPEKVTVGHTEYRVETDFRAALRAILAYEDNTLTSQEKQAVLMINLYPTWPDDLAEAMQQASWFLNGGTLNESESDSSRLYSFAKDAQLIFAAFRQTHNIDLNTARLHWWVFLSLFMDLGQDTAFCQLVALRKRVKDGKATPEEKVAARAMGEIFDIPETDTRTLEEKERAQKFFELVTEGERKRGTRYG